MAEFTLDARVLSTHLEEKGWSVRGINEIGWYRERASGWKMGNIHPVRPDDRSLPPSTHNESILV
jgi:hypothetical protein